MKKKKTFKRRDFLVGLSGLALLNFFTFSMGKTQTNVKIRTEDSDMKLRPHHILDIIKGHGIGKEYHPTPAGNSQHIIAPRLLSNLDLKIELVLDADDICEGCKFLLPDGKCSNVLGQIKPSPSMQAYNDVLDSRLFDYFSMEVGTVMTFREFLEMVNQKCRILIDFLGYRCTCRKNEGDQQNDCCYFVFHWNFPF